MQSIQPPGKDNIFCWALFVSGRANSEDESRMPYSHHDWSFYFLNVLLRCPYFILSIFGRVEVSVQMLSVKKLSLQLYCHCPYVIEASPSHVCMYVAIFLQSKMQDVIYVYIYIYCFQLPNYGSKYWLLFIWRLQHLLYDGLDKNTKGMIKDQQNRGDQRDNVMSSNLLSNKSFQVFETTYWDNRLSFSLLSNSAGV